MSDCPVVFVSSADFCCVFDGSTVLFKMEEYVKTRLDTNLFEQVGSFSGCVNGARIYATDQGKVFIKFSSEPEARVMFDGELESLHELARTETVKVPKPLLVGNVGRECFIVLEYLDLRCLRKHSSRLGTLLAELHLHNIQKLKKRDSGFVNSEDPAVEKFGFHVPTSCGFISQPNEWTDDWVTFYTRDKLETQINLILSKDRNLEVSELWSQLQLKIPRFFKDIKVEPSLLHGDLWIGNTGETEKEPVVFDAGSFYGHHEYDLAIAIMFNGFSNTFFNSYHNLIPKSSGFNQRLQLYLLFHHLNHWNHFGTYKQSSLQIMRSLVKSAQ